MSSYTSKLKKLGNRRLNQQNSLIPAAKKLADKKIGKINDDYNIPTAIENTINHPNLKALSDSRKYEGYEGLEASIKRRINLMDASNHNIKFRQNEWSKCKSDICYWVNSFVWTYDPRTEPRTLPFDLFPKQEEYLNWVYDRLNNKESGLVEKSRDMGLTWLSCAVAAHQWLFYPESKVTIGSRKEMLVDRLGDPDSIFEKLRMLIRLLPKWMLPSDYLDAYLRIINYDNNSAITGEAGKQLGRGGRAGLCLVDEYAFVENADSIDAALSQTGNCILYISTPNGQNAFYRKRMSGKIPVFRFHWKQDPRKDEEWYKKMESTLDPHVLAQEINIDYTSSVEGLVIPSEWVIASLEFPLYFEDSGEVIAGLDISDDGNCFNVIVIRKGIRVIHIEAWNKTDTVETAYKAKLICDKYKVNRLYYDSIGVGAGVGGVLRKQDYLSFDYFPLGNASAIDRNWEEFNYRNGKEIFINARAERWWSLRVRFEKTAAYTRKIKAKDYDPNEEVDWHNLISIPNHDQLIPQLSWPKWDHNDRGLIRIESKADMKKRGIPSPDYADALSYAFTPIDPGASWMLGLIK
jgi:phage terminase large subunit